jgi:tripartite ATP-independent transporter DctM subunit
MLFLLLSGILVVTLLLGQWTAFALGTAGAIVLLIAKGPLGLLALSSVVWNASNSYILIAVPMFLLMGEIIQRSGAGQHFYAGVAYLLGRLPGGLLHANILSCAIFAAVSGSSVATAATVGTVAIPEMRKRGYDAKMVFGSLAAGGTLGILIPPSIIMVLYGALVEESVAKLFMAGVVPGLLMAALFMVYIAARLVLDRRLVPTVATEEAGPRARAADMLHIMPVTALLVVVLGGIYSGITTPTEAAAVGAAGALVLAAAYRSLTRKVFWDSVLATVRTTCMVSLILVSAQVLSTALTYSGASRGVSGWVLSLGLEKWSFFVVLVGLYLVLGCFVDGISMIYMTLPVLLPVLKTMGFDLIWLGVVLTILIELGQITPPVGLNLFTIHAISGGTSFRDVVSGSAPYVLLMLIMIAALALWPEVALWLPSLIR